MFRRIIVTLVLLSLVGGCTLFEPIKEEQAGSFAEPEVSRLEAKNGELIKHNQDIRKSLDKPVMSTPPREGSGVIGEIDVAKTISGSQKQGAVKGKATPVKLEFTDTSLKDIIVVFMQDYLKKPYIFQDSFKDQKVNIFFDAAATREEMIQLFDTLLDNYGVRLRYSSGVYLIGGADEKGAPARQPSPLKIGDAVGVFQPRFIDSKDFVQLAKQVVKQGDSVSALPTNVVIVNSTSTDVRSVALLLQEVDVPAFANKRILVYVPRYLTPAGLVAILENYQTQLSSGQTGTRQFEAKQVPDSSRIVIVAANKVARDLVLEFLDKTDVADANQRRVFQYVLGTQTAVDLLPNLNALLKAVLKNQVDVNIIADKTTNSLFIYASPEEFAEIRKLLARLDYRPPAIQVDIVIATVNLNAEMRYGVEWYLKNTGQWLADVSTSVGLDKTITTGFGAGIVSPGNNYATLQLIGSQTSFALLSSPSIVVKNGATARIAVGQEQPVIKQKTINNAAAGANTVVEPEFKKIGLELEVTPYVTQNNEVRMVIKLKDTSITGNVVLGSDTYPVLANREVSTDLVTSEGKTIFLGGIRQQQVNDTAQKIPGLGDAQYLGSIFRSKDMQDFGQELIILATPAIMLDQQGADVITRAIINAAKRDLGQLRKAIETKKIDKNSSKSQEPAKDDVVDSPTT